MQALALIQLLLPLALILWLSAGRPVSFLDLGLRMVAAALLLAGVWLAGLWLALPWRTVQLLALVFALAAGVAIVRFRSRSPTKMRPIPIWISRAAAVTASAVGLWLVVPAAAGRVAPEEAVDLAFPFAEGQFIVANGGSSERINGHLMTLRPEYARWRGESYGVDLIRVDDLGFRTRERRLLAMPETPDSYLSWNMLVRAPCDGSVLAVEDRRPDMPVPIRDRDHLEGNYVRLRCGQIEVFLGHFRRDAVQVRAGDVVRVGHPLGLVGNSGNTDEPHLHVHAQRPGPTEAPLSGEPLFATFNHRFLARNMIVDAGAER